MLAHPRRLIMKQYEMNDAYTLSLKKAGYTATDVACEWAGGMIKPANLSIWAGAAKDAQKRQKSK